MAQPRLKSTQDTDASAFDAIHEMMARERAAQAVPPAGPDRHVFEGTPQDVSRRPVNLGLSHPENAPLRQVRSGFEAIDRPGATADLQNDDDAPSATPSAPRSSRNGAVIRARMRKAAIGLIGFMVGLALILAPVLLVGVLLATVGFCLISALLSGYDAFWRRALRPVRAYVARRPDRAAEVHRRLDAIAFRWDRVLDRFPERLVAGLYLPDISDIAAIADESEAPIDLRMT